MVNVLAYNDNNKHEKYKIDLHALKYSMIKPVIMLYILH